MNTSSALQDLLRQLAAANIRLAVLDGKLSVDAPRGSVTPALRDALTQHKEQLLAHLSDAISVQPRDAGLPLSFAQQRLWLLDQLEGGSPRYNLLSATRLRGPLNIELLQQALNHAVARHEILRTQFALGSDGTPRQFAISDLIVPMQQEDLRQQADPAASLQAAISAEKRHVFNLAQAPLLRSRLLRIADDEHVLLGNMHHIITDALSNDIFSQELSQLYAALLQGVAPQLSLQTIQYGDFADWQRTDLSGEKLAEGLAFWREELRDLPALLPLPTDYPRPATRSYRGDAVAVRIPPKQVARLQQLAQASNASLFMLLTAALAICLGRHASSQDIAIGTPVAGRTRPELEGLIGFFINAVVLRCRLTGSPTFRQLLTQVRDSSLRAFAQQDTPFEQIVDALSSQRDLSYTPLFQVMLSFINRRETTTPASGSLQAERMVIAQHDVLFDLDWQLRETEFAGEGWGVEGFLIYATSLFSRQTAERIVAHFLRTLEAALDQPDANIDSFDILTPQERETLLYRWNQTAIDWPQDGLTPQRIAAQTERTPDAIAVRGGDEAWSYRQLDTVANQIAQALLAQGVQPGARVGICLTRTPRMLATLLAVWKVGAAYLPLDPAFPADRLGYMVQDAGAALTVSEDAVASELRQRFSTVAPLLLLEDAMQNDGDPSRLALSLRSPTITAASEAAADLDGNSANVGLRKLSTNLHGATNPNPAFNMPTVDPLLSEDGGQDSSSLALSLRSPTFTAHMPIPDAEPDRAAIVGLRKLSANLHDVTNPLAYVIYTSGSTGLPKGVMVGHAALDNFLRSMQQAPGLQASDVLLAVTTISFDISLLELFLPLTVGAQVVIAPQLASSDPQQLQQLITNATAMQATPATWRMLLAAGWQGSPQLKALCGGEALPRDLSRSLLGKVGTLWNMYGPTETTIWSAVRQIRADEAAGDGIEPVGQPIANTQIYVLNSALQPAPIGSIGELCIGGDGLAQGYWQRPELSAEKFVANPFVPGGKLYCTGDSARYAADGTLHFLGRIDHQVKLRGFRIELGEIESLLGRHPAIAHCSVIIREDVPGDQRLVAYYVATPATTLADAHGELRSHLRATLPEYMLPSVFVALPAMPLTPNGKVDRKALPAPDATVATPMSRQENASELELKIAALWAEILRQPDPGLHSNFFDLGGHSLLVVQLHQRLSSELGVTFDALDLFRHPTIAGQAALLGGQTQQKDVRSEAQSRAQQQRQALMRQRAMHRG